MKKIDSLPTWRKIALASWKDPTDPGIQGFLEIDMEKATEYLNRYEEEHGVKITVTHLVTKAVAMALKKNSQVNACLRWGNIYLRDTVDIFLQVALGRGQDLSGAKLNKVDEKSLSHISEELRQQAEKIRNREDPQFEKTFRLINWLPIPLLRWVLKISDFIGNTLLLHLPSLGIPRDPFGSCMITSVGMFGIEVGFAPFVTFARTPLIVVIGKVDERPRVIDGEVVPRKTLLISATFDHRIVDGFQVGRFSHDVKRYLENPTDEIFHNTGQEENPKEEENSPGEE